MLVAAVKTAAAGGDDEEEEEEERRRRSRILPRLGIQEDEAVMPTAIIATLDISIGVSFRFVSLRFASFRFFRGCAALAGC